MAAAKLPGMPGSSSSRPAKTSPFAGRRRASRAQARLGDVAALAGVSTATVSRVMNGTGSVSEPIRRRVLRAVQHLNYHPNAYARALASGRSHQIGLLISDISNPFFPELTRSIERAAFQHGLEVVLSETDHDPERLARSVRRFLERDVAGVIIMASEVDPSLLDGLARRQVPLVFLDLRATAERTSTISVDYARGIDEAVSHLAGLGHRRLGYVAGPSRFASAAKRLQAFRAAVERHVGGAPAPAVYEGDFRLESGLRAAAEILASRLRPTAVLTANDLTALGLMKGCRAGRLVVPRDISIVGFDDIAFASLSDPPLSTVCLPRDELGRRAVETLVRSLGDATPIAVEIEVPTHFIARGSTAPAPAEAGREATAAAG
jgi:LacI family transcriptional regulator